MVGIALTGVDALAKLFPAAGSSVGEDTVTRFVAVPAAAGAVIVTVIGGAAPGASDARVHVIVVEPPHDQPLPAAETSPAPEGSASDTETEVAVEGPPLDTFNVYVINCPVQIAAGAPLCVTARSARANTLDVVATALLPVEESFVVELTAALLRMAPAVAGAVTAIETGAATLTPSDGSVQVTGPVPVHVQPEPVAETNVVPGGACRSAKRNWPGTDRRWRHSG